MSDRVYFSDELIAPISAQNPAGRNLRDEAIFRQILDARRSDDQLNAGDWKTVDGPKVAEWDRVAEMCLEALKDASKDLRLVCFLTEAAIRLDGFRGLRDCLRLTKELLYRFWDLGLFPEIEEGDLDYRASSMTWFNDRMPETMHWVPLTARTGENYNFIRYLQALQIGTEEAIQGASGEKRDTIAGLRRQGWISLDAFDGAIKATKLKDFEEICNTFDEAYEQFRSMRKVVDERFGDEGPSLASANEAFEEMQGVLRRALKMKRDQEPPPRVTVNGPEIQPPATRTPATMVGFWTAGMPTDQSGSWQQAEALVRDGDVDQGLKRMAALAGQETSGRAQFLRKLMLVDVCRNTGRDRLARTVLEELNQQIGDYKLDRWESSALVGAVWSRLYRFYKKSETSTEQDQAVVLYNQLCRLDPWQAYVDCED